MAHSFNNYFGQKILNIYSGFPSSTLSQGKPLVEESYLYMMDTFEPFTETDIRQLLKRSSNPFGWPYAYMAYERLSECSDKQTFNQ